MGSISHHITTSISICLSFFILFSSSDIIIWSLLFCIVIIFPTACLWPHFSPAFTSLTCSHSQMAVTHSEKAMAHQSLLFGLGQDCELLVLLSDKTCPGLHHQVQYVAGFPQQLAALLNVLAQGHCLVHRKIPIRDTALHLSSLFYHELSYIPLQLLDFILTLFQRPRVASFTKVISNFSIN